MKTCAANISCTPAAAHIHENCGNLRETMGEGKAKRYLHEAVAKRGQKRNAAKTGVSEFSADPARFFQRKPYKLNDLSASKISPDLAWIFDDSDSTDEDMPALVDHSDTARTRSPPPLRLPVDDIDSPLVVNAKDALAGWNARVLNYMRLNGFTRRVPYVLGGYHLSRIADID